MRRHILLIACCLCCASPAWALRAHDPLDADQRAKVTLSGDQAAPVLSVAPAPASANDTADAALLAPRPQPQAEVRPLTSTVPEPSGYAMLGVGLLLLLLRPRQPDDAAIAPAPDKHGSL